MTVRFALGSLRKYINFYLNNPASIAVDVIYNIASEIGNSIESTHKGVKTKTPFISVWERQKYNQVYCKQFGWFIAYTTHKSCYIVRDMIHQQELSDNNQNQLPHFSPNQDLSVFDSWDYIKDANYGYGIVRNSKGQYNYMDLNGDLLVKDKEKQPIWFDDVTVFYDSSADDRLHAFALYNGMITYVYSNGKYLVTDKTLQDMGMKSLHEMCIKKNKVILTESELQWIISESVKKILRTMI